ncbi:MAG: MBL fold metallo-hydrolase RNA specificity domain-containing protein [Candidatus Kapaibacterium sp.]
MRIEFHGAAQTVTGSMHLVHCNGKRVLLDCGLFQGRRAEAARVNATFPFDPASIDAVVLSHAHIDHSGNLPHLVKCGFDGTIYSTSATRDLCAIMLADSAMIQEKDAEHLRKHDRDVAEPLYTAKDVARTMELFTTVGYHREFDVVSGMRARFHDAGHILGSAITMLTLTENGKRVRLCFTGDVGRPDRPILRDPEFPGEADIIISESTYGGRLHEELGNLDETLVSLIQRVVSENGKLLVPAFSIGRTQDIVYHLNELYNTGRIPDVPVYVDSPLAINATNIYRLHPECYDDDIRHLMLRDPDPFGFPSLTYVREAEESKRLNGKRGPAVIIAASGMCESGRILHHLSNNIESRHTTVLIVGFNAQHTLGRRLADGYDMVNIYGVPHHVRANIEKISGFSAHADEAELRSFLRAFTPGSVTQVCLVHGEPEAQEALKKGLREDGFATVTNPAKGDVVEL